MGRVWNMHRVRIPGCLKFVLGTRLRLVRSGELAIPDLFFSKRDWLKLVCTQP